MDELRVGFSAHRGLDANQVGECHGPTPHLGPRKGLCGTYSTQDHRIRVIDCRFVSQLNYIQRLAPLGRCRIYLPLPYSCLRIGVVHSHPEADLDVSLDSLVKCFLSLEPVVLTCPFYRSRSRRRSTGEE